MSRRTSRAVREKSERSQRPIEENKRLKKEEKAMRKVRAKKERDLRDRNNAAREAEMAADEEAERAALEILAREEEQQGGRPPKYEDNANNDEYNEHMEVEVVNSRRIASQVQQLKEIKFNGCDLRTLLNYIDERLDDFRADSNEMYAPKISSAHRGLPRNSKK